MKTQRDYGALIVHVDSTGLDMQTSADALMFEARNRMAWVELRVDMPALTYGEALRAWSLTLQETYGTIPVASDIRTQDEYRVQVGYGAYETYPMGHWELRDVDATISVDGYNMNDGLSFRVTTRRMYRPNVEQLFERARARMEKDSIYRGKLLRARRESTWGTYTFEYLEPWASDLDALRYNVDTLAAIRSILLARIRYREMLAIYGIAPSGGALLHGPNGVGKTRLMRAIAGEAITHGWTYVETSAETIADIYEMTAAMGPTIIGAEDLDTLPAGHNEAAELRNTLDGIRSLDRQVLVIATSNAAARVDPGLLRHGRLAKLHIGMPDAGTAVELLRLYGGNDYVGITDWETHGNALAGRAPAMIARTVETSKLAALVRSNGQSVDITDNDLTEAIQTLIQEDRQTSDVAERRTPSDLERAASIIAEAMPDTDAGEWWDETSDYRHAYGAPDWDHYGTGGQDIPLETE